MAERTPRPAPRRRAAVGLALALSAIALTGCTDDSDAGTATRGAGAKSPDAPVVEPGRPGEANKTLTGRSAAPRTPAAPAPADITFMQHMIVHHAQAVTMVDLVDGKLTDPGAKALAKRIAVEQEPEMGVMVKWLRRHGQSVPPEAKNPKLAASGHHSSMPGMATKQQLADLQKAGGKNVDRQFLTLMIRHHQGAVSMVGTRSKSGTDIDAERLGDDISSTQTVQIGRMKSILRALGGPAQTS